MKKAGSPKAGARRLERQRSREIFGSLDSPRSGPLAFDSTSGRSQDCGSPVAPLVGFLARAESRSVEGCEQPARGKISAQEDGEKTPASPTATGSVSGFGSVVSAEEAELAKIRCSTRR